VQSYAASTHDASTTVLGAAATSAWPPSGTAQVAASAAANSDDVRSTPKVGCDNVLTAGVPSVASDSDRKAANKLSGNHVSL